MELELEDIITLIKHGYTQTTSIVICQLSASQGTLAYNYANGK